MSQTSIQSSKEHKLSGLRADTSYQQIESEVHARSYRMDQGEVGLGPVASLPLKLLA